MSWWLCTFGFGLFNAIKDFMKDNKKNYVTKSCNKNFIL